jgi:hypothetical protein
MSARRVAGWGSGLCVVLSSASAALINELQAGWRWWVAAGIAVVLTALSTVWVALRAGSPRGDQLGAGAVKAGRDIRGNVETSFKGSSVPMQAPPSSGAAPGPGAVEAGRDIEGSIRTTINIASQKPDQT